MHLANASRHIDDPLAPLVSPAHWLVDLAPLLVIGLLLGIYLARMLRTRALHWSWALGALAGIGAFRSALGALATPLALASGYAMFKARRRHREDIEAGADLADAAARRRRPFDIVRAIAGWIALRRSRALAPGGWFRRGEMIVGLDRAGRLVSIPCGGAGGGTHTLLVGATGSGKTVTQAWMAARAIERGMAAIVIDPKGDRRMRAVVASAAQAERRRFIEWTPRGPSSYNPFARGSDTEIADKVLAGERFTEPHYLRQAQRLLGHVVRVLRGAGEEIDLRSIVQNLDPSNLEMLARTLERVEAECTESYLDSLTTRQLADISGVRDRLAILAESDVGRWLDSRVDAAARFDLLEAVEARAVVYFDLDADSRPLLTQMLGAAIIQDLQTTVASLQGCARPAIVVIDEFATIATDQVVRLFGRARSAGFNLVLGTQELSDLRLHGQDGLLERVMGNLTTVLAHRQVVPSSAELIASLAGTAGTWKTTRLADGRVTRTRVRDRALNAETVMSLRPGCVAALVLSDDRKPRFAQVLPPDSAS